MFQPRRLQTGTAGFWLERWPADAVDNLQARQTHMCDNLLMAMLVRAYGRAE